MNLPEIVKDYVAPIIGALAGSGLSFHFDKSGSSSRRSDVSIENSARINGDGNSISNVNIVNNSKRTINYGQQGGSDGGEIFAIMILGIAAVVLAVYFYSLYAPLIFFYIMLSIQAVATFSAFFGLTGGLRGTNKWGAHGLHVAMSLMLLGVAYFYCVPKLYGGYNPEYTTYAQQYGAWDYYGIIGKAAKDWIISQIIGLACLVGALAFTAMFVISGSLRPRIVTFAVTALLLFGSTFGAEGKFHTGF